MSGATTMKSQGEIEAAVCDGISRFQQEFIGRGPKDIHSHLIGTLLVVRLQGVLTPAERQLIAPQDKAGAGDGNESPSRREVVNCSWYAPHAASFESTTA